MGALAKQTTVCVVVNPHNTTKQEQSIIWLLFCFSEDRESVQSVAVWQGVPAHTRLRQNKIDGYKPSTLLLQAEREGFDRQRRSGDTSKYSNTISPQPSLK